MTIADKLTLLANTKEALRAKLKLAKSVPFSKYPDYVNWNTAPSIPNKAFYADFTNDRYVKDGVPCNFKDLFTFTRAGKAWLVKDTGLQEYAADVPKLDKGLFIEQEATNHTTKNISGEYLSLENTANRENSIISKGGYNFYTRKGTANETIIQYTLPTIPEGSELISSFTVLLDLSVPSRYIYVGTGHYGRYSYRIDTIEKTMTELVGGFEKTKHSLTLVNGSIYKVTYDFPRATGTDLYRRTFTIKATDQLWETHSGMDGSNYTSEDKDTVSFALLTSTVTDNSSLIPTDGVRVTRPADYLLNNITGTTVAGDWDSTLTLSIVAGKLVHSGYGRIRSLEIN